MQNNSNTTSTKFYTSLYFYLTIIIYLALIIVFSSRYYTRSFNDLYLIFWFFLFLIPLLALYHWFKEWWSSNYLIQPLLTSWLAALLYIFYMLSINEPFQFFDLLRIILTLLYPVFLYLIIYCWYCCTKTRTRAIPVWIIIFIIAIYVYIFWTGLCALERYDVRAANRTVLLPLVATIFWIFIRRRFFNKSKQLNSDSH